MRRYQRGVIADLIVYGVILAAALGAAALIYAAIGNHFTAPLKLQLTACAQATKVATDANAGLQADLDKLRAAYAAQGAAVQALSDAAAAAQARADAAMAAERARRAGAAPQVAKLEAIKNAPPTKEAANGCAALDSLLTDIANDRLRFNGAAGQPSPGAGGQGAGADSLRIK